MSKSLRIGNNGEVNAEVKAQSVVIAGRVVGNVTATRVSYKGKPVDLESRARDNVARFELR